MGSGTISLPCSGYFSPFPHGTSSLSVSQEYLALPDGPGRFTQGFTCPALLRILLDYICLHVQDFHPLWFNFPENSILQIISYCSPTTPTLPKQSWFGLFPVRSPLLRESLIVFFSSAYLDVSVQRVCPPITRGSRLTSGGLPHSEIFESNSYLHLIEAYRSLSRLSSPLRA
jgi:hypothetical protein